MNRLATTLLALVLISSPVLATTPDTLINGGTLDFDYVGTVNGNFASNGSLVAAPATEGTAATTYVLDGLNYLVVTGAQEDGVNFVDGGVLIISSVAPIVPGVYALDAVNAVFIFVDDAAGWTPPADLFNTNWTNELAAMAASGKYGSTSGSVTLTSVTATLVSGTFTANMMDPNTLGTLAVTSGAFNVEGVTSTEDATWGSVKSMHR